MSGGAAVVSRRLMALMREAYGTGDFGGWRRCREFDSDMMIVWRHRSEAEWVVLEPAAKPGRPATLRIGIRDRDGLWEVAADCKVHSFVAAMKILNAYNIVASRHTASFQQGRRDIRRMIREVLIP